MGVGDDVLPVLGRVRSEAEIGLGTFDRRDQIDALLMAAALELGGEEGGQDLIGQPLAHHTGTDAENVRVIVLAGHARGVQVVAERSTHAVHLVRRQLLALAAAPENDAHIRTTVAYGAPDGSADRRVVDALDAVRAVIGDIVSCGLQHLDEMLLQQVTGVVGSNCYA